MIILKINFKVVLTVFALILSISPNAKVFAALPDEVKDDFSNAIVLYENGSKAYVNGIETSIGDKDSFFKPETIKGRVLVPVGFIAKSLGGKVKWNGKEKTVTILTKDKTIKFKIGDKKYTVNGKENSMDIAPKWGYHDYNRVYIPVRALTQVFEKNLFCQNGLIIISDNKSFNFEKPLYNKILTSLAVPGLYVLDTDAGKLPELIDNTDLSEILKVENQWIYITDYENIYKININTLEKIKVVSDKINDASKVIVEKGYVYYSNASDGNKIYKVNEKDSSKIRINNDNSSIVSIVDAYIYYYTEKNTYGEDYGKISRIKIDGTGKKRLTKLDSVFEGVVDGWLYYDKVEYPVGYGVPGKLHRLKHDGSKYEQLADSRGQIQNIEKDKIYLKLGSVMGSLARMDRDGKNLEVLVDGAIVNFYKVNDWIYYYRTDRSIYRVNINTKKKEKVFKDEGSYSFQIADNHIYFESANGLSVADMDGKNLRSLLEGNNLLNSRELGISVFNISGNKLFLRLYNRTQNKVDM